MEGARRNVLLSMIVSNEILIKSVLNLDENSSESESEMDELLYIMQFSRLRGKRKKIVRIEGYVNDIVPRFTTHQFKEHFRMTPNCFQILENQLGLILSKPKMGRHSYHRECNYLLLYGYSQLLILTGECKIL